MCVIPYIIVHASVFYLRVTRLGCPNHSLPDTGKQHRCFRQCLGHEDRGLRLQAERMYSGKCPRRLDRGGFALVLQGKIVRLRLRRRRRHLQAHVRVRRTAGRAGDADGLVEGRPAHSFCQRLGGWTLSDHTGVQRGDGGVRGLHLDRHASHVHRAGV